MNLDLIKSVIKKHPLGAIASGVLLIMLVALFWRHSDMVEMKAALERNTAEAQRHLTNISYAVQLEEHLKALESANQTIAGRLVNPQDLAVNLQYFYKLEAESGVKLLDTRPAMSGSGSGRAQPTMKAGYKPVQYAVSVQGNYNRVLTFLRRLEQGSYYCRVVAATCNPAQEESVVNADKKTAEIILSLTVEIIGKA